MQRSSRFLILAVIAVGACAPEKQAVYVNREKAISGELTLARAALKARDWPKVDVSANYSWTTEEERVFGYDLLERRLAEARELIRVNREIAFQSLRKDVLEALTRELERERAERGDDLEASIAKEMSAVESEIRRVLESYADKRGPLATRLAYHVGYPFPPQSKLPEPPPDRPLRAKMLKEAGELYVKIDALEAQFRDDMEAISERLFVRIASERLDLGVAIANRMAEIQRQAEADARSALSATNDAIDLSLIQEGTLRLPPQPGHGVAIAAQSPNTGKRGETPLPQAIIARRAEVEADLKIWVGIHAYRLVDDPRRGADRTDEFLTWRRNDKAGR